MKNFYKNIKVSHKVTKLSIESVIDKTHRVSLKRKLAKSVIREVCGLMPYEKKVIDFIKADNNKKARKFCKVRLGSLKRGEKKLEELTKECL